jgi:hypothetical protein
MRRRGVILMIISSALVFGAGLDSAQAQQGRKEFTNYLGTTAAFYIADSYYNYLYVTTAEYTPPLGVGTTPLQDFASVGIGHVGPDGSIGHTCYPAGAPYGQFDVPAEAVSISKDLRTASAKWTFLCTDAVTTVEIDISWLASGRQYASTFQVVSHEPFGMLAGQFFFREQTFASGTVRIADGPVQNLDITEQSWEGLMRVHQGYIESTK